MRSLLGRRLPARGLVAAVAALAVAGSLVACGSSDDNSSGSTGASSTSSASPEGIKEATAYLAELGKTPTTLGLPISKKPIPTGKTVTMVSCGVADCDAEFKVIQQTAAILGWKAKYIPTDGSPAGIAAGWNRVVALKPDVAFGHGFPHSVFAPQLAKLKAMGIPVFNFASFPDPSGNQGNGVIISKVTTTEEEIPLAKQMAGWVVTSSKGQANTLYVDLPAFPILKTVRENFTAAYKKWCPGCALATLNLPVKAIGTTAPSQVVSYLRSHPKVNRIAFSYDGIADGLPAALKTAGLSGKVQFVGEGPTATNIAYIKAGTQAATVALAKYESWANMMDAAARYLTGQSLDANVKFPAPYFLYTKSSTRDGVSGPTFGGYWDELKKMWLKE